MEQHFWALHSAFMSIAEVFGVCMCIHALERSHQIWTHIRNLLFSRLLFFPYLWIGLDRSRNARLEDKRPFSLKFTAVKLGTQR